MADIVHPDIELTGIPSQLLVEPETEQIVENGKSAVFRVQVQDIANNNTATDGRQSIVCKVWYQYYCLFICLSWVSSL